MINKTILYGALILLLLASIVNIVELHRKDLFSTVAISEQSLTQDPIQAYAHNIDLTKVPPPGSPPNLPGLEASEEDAAEIEKARSIYGGKKEQGHLGGFTTIDPHGISPMVWSKLLESLGIKSILDVGCGRGISTSWFYLQGVKVECVEGSHDAFDRSMLLSLVKEKDKDVDLSKVMVEHDFSRGPWWPEQTVDMVWSVEFLEHVGRNFEKNYLTAFKKAAFVVVTHSNWGGWHHTEVHNSDWWISRFTMNGFIYSPELTKHIKDLARMERTEKIAFPLPNVTEYYFAQHLMTAMVFINPAVASRIEHAHLLSEPGCFTDYNNPNHHCGHGSKKVVESKIPDEYMFIPYDENKHIEWENYLKKSVELDAKEINKKESDN